MTARPQDAWPLVMKAAYCDLYRVREDLIAVFPHDDICDNQDSARSMLRAQADYWKQVGHGGAVIVFMDPIREQDAGARAVYATESGSVGTVCFALIGASYFAMASSIVYTGLSRPSVPLEVFRTYEDALTWVDEMLAHPRA